MYLIWLDEDKDFFINYNIEKVGFIQNNVT